MPIIKCQHDVWVRSDSKTDGLYVVKKYLVIFPHNVTILRYGHEFSQANVENEIFTVKSRP